MWNGRIEAKGFEQRLVRQRPIEKVRERADALRWMGGEFIAQTILRGSVERDQISRPKKEPRGRFISGQKHCRALVPDLDIRKGFSGLWISGGNKKTEEIAVGR